VHAKFGENFLGILVSQGDYNTETKYLYIYNLESQVYDGFVDLSAIIGVPTKSVPLDFIFLEDKSKASIAVCCSDKIFLIGQTQKQWTLIHTYTPLMNLNSEVVKSLNFELMGCSARKTMSLLVN